MEILSLGKKNFIELSELLRKLHFCYSKSEAEDLILGGLISVNGITDIRVHTKISFGDIVEVKGHKIMIE